MAVFIYVFQKVCLLWTGLLSLFVCWDFFTTLVTYYSFGCFITPFEALLPCHFLGYLLLFWLPGYPVRLLPCLFSTWTFLMCCVIFLLTSCKGGLTDRALIIGLYGWVECTSLIGRNHPSIRSTRSPLKKEFNSSFLSFVLSFWFGPYLSLH